MRTDTKTPEDHKEYALGFVDTIEANIADLHNVIADGEDTIGVAIGEAIDTLRDTVSQVIYEIESARDLLESQLPCRTGIEEFVDELLGEDSDLETVLHDTDYHARQGNYREAYEDLAAAVRENLPTPAETLASFKI